MEGYFMMAWFAVSLAIWVCAFTETSELFERIWHPATYLMLPISGFAFMVSWLPLKYQGLALKLPMVNGCEMIRDGFFGNVIRCRYSVPYLSCWCLGLSLMGLIMLKRVARDGGARMIRLENVSKSYAVQGGRRTVLDKINLVVKPGEKIGVLGRNGSGKSTDGPSHQRSGESHQRQDHPLDERLLAAGIFRRLPGQPQRPG